MRDTHLAEEVCQAVFITLARKAGALGDKTILSGWLCRTARYTAADELKKLQRRQRREQEAHQGSLVNEPESEVWQRIEPLLEAAMEQLGRKDHDALVLRFFENKSFAEVGSALGAGEDAAKMRVNRALEKLRHHFNRRGVTLGTAAIAGAVAANAVTPASAGLVATISTTATIAVPHAAASMILTSLTKPMIISPLQKIAVSVALSLSVGVGIYQAMEISQTRAEARTLQQQQAEQIRQWQAERDRSSNTVAALKEELTKNTLNHLELLKLRGQVGLLRNKADALRTELQAVQSRLSEASPSSQDSNPDVPAPNQIHLKARFYSLPKETLTGMKSFLTLHSSGKAGFSGLLSENNFTNLLSWIEGRNGAESLAAPEITTLDGKQLQMRATQVISVITNIALLETNGTVTMIPELEQVGTGPLLDATPRILADGSTIELSVNASVTDFLGYHATSRTVPLYAKSGERVDAPEVSPQFWVQSFSSKVNLFDGQTLVFKLDDKLPASNDSLVNASGERVEVRNDDRWVILTPTIVDSARDRKSKPLGADGIPGQTHASN